MREAAFLSHPPIASRTLEDYWESLLLLQLAQERNLWPEMKQRGKVYCGDVGCQWGKVLKPKGRHTETHRLSLPLWSEDCQRHYTPPQTSRALLVEVCHPMLST